MILDGRVLGMPLVQYSDTKANVAALTLTAADAGAEAYATDTGEIGVYSGSAWVWGKTVTNGNSHDHDGGDGAQIDHTKMGNVGTNTHAQIDTHVGSTSNPHSVTAAQVGADITTATVHAAASKDTPVDADETALLDSAVSYGLKKLTWSAIKTTLKAYFDTLYNKYVHPNHSGDVTSVGDGATTIVNKQTLGYTAPIAITNTPTVIAGAAPVVSVAAASESATGVVERATDAEALAMTDTTRYVSPSHLGKYTVTDQLFGNGADGDATISTTTTLTRDMYYNNLTVNSGVILNTGGYRIFVKGTLTLNGTIRNIGGNGGNASGATAGTAGSAAAAGSLKASPAGVVGATGLTMSGGFVADGNAGITGTAEGTSDGGSSGVTGGAGGNETLYLNYGGVGGAAGTATAASAAYGDLNNPLMGILFRLFTTTGVVVPGYHAGNGSGGSGACANGGTGSTISGGGGGSGGNGGFIVLAARKITGAGTVSVAGGNGGNGGNASGSSGAAGGGGGGAGGSGGIIVLLCLEQSAITLTVSGGTAGSGGAKYGVGLVGSAGTAGRSGVVIEL